MKKHFLMLTFCLTLVSWANAQNSEKERPNRFILSGGIFKPEINSTLQLDHMNDMLDTKLSLEDDLGLDRKIDAYRIDVWFRMSKRLALNGGWYSAKRSASVNLQKEINYMDSVYQAGAQVNTRMNTSFASASLRYSILCKEKVEAGLSLGVRWATIDAKAEAISDGITVTHDFKGSAPAPLPGLFVSAHLLPSLMINYNLEYFRVSYSDVDGGVREHRISLAWFPVRNLGAGLGWSDVKYHVSGIPFKNDFTGDVNHTLKGFTFFVATRF